MGVPNKRQRHHPHHPPTRLPGGLLKSLSPLSPHQSYCVQPPSVHRPPSNPTVHNHPLSTVPPSNPTVHSHLLSTVPTSNPCHR